MIMEILNSIITAEISIKTDSQNKEAGI